MLFGNCPQVSKQNQDPTPPINKKLIEFGPLQKKKLDFFKKFEKKINFFFKKRQMFHKLSPNVVKPKKLFPDDYRRIIGNVRPWCFSLENVYYFV